MEIYETTDWFWEYARERYLIMLRKEGGDKWPWTQDISMQKNRFCNIFREDDKVTKWIAKHVRDPLKNDSRVLPAIVIARWFNRIPTLESFLPTPGHKSLFIDWSSYEAKARIEFDQVDPIFTGAYMIASPKGMSKLDGVSWNIDRFLSCIDEHHEPDWLAKANNLIEGPGRHTLKSVCDWLQWFPGLGAFYAYEIVTDLRHTALLNQAPDIMTWANPGPGAARGASRLLGKPVDHLSRTSRKDAPKLQHIMQNIVAQSQNDSYWPQEWPAWEMREAEHTLCEFDKWMRVKEGEGGRMKNKYRAPVAA